jgi:hypothetical protein
VGGVGLALSLFLITALIVQCRRSAPDGPEYLPLA